MKVLGLLEKAAPEVIGAAEASEFASWLAEPAQIAALGAMIGRDLAPAAGAISGGGGIVCTDRRSGAAALVTGRVGASDSAGLGGLLTAAAEANARTVIWYLTELTAAHRATLDWFGRITGQSLSIHVVEVEFWRVGENALAPRLSLAHTAAGTFAAAAPAAPAASPAPAAASAPASGPASGPAPAAGIVSSLVAGPAGAVPAAASPAAASPAPAPQPAPQPEAQPEPQPALSPEPVQAQAAHTGDPAMSEEGEESPEECLAYWTAFVARAAYTVPGLRLGPPEGSPFLTSAVSDGVHLFCGLSKAGRLVRTGIVLDGEGAPALFSALSDSRAPLEKALDAPLVWDAGSDHGRPNLYISLDETDPGDRADWPRQHRWLAETARRLHAAVGPKLAAQAKPAGETKEDGEA